MVDFKALAQRQTTLSEVMIDREKVKTDDLIEAYPDGVTITAFDYVMSKKTKNEYPVFNIAEDDKIFCNGGTVLDRIFSEYVRVFEGDVTKASNELKRQGGLKVKLGHGTTKDGQELITVEVL